MSAQPAEQEPTEKPTFRKPATIIRFPKRKTETSTEPTTKQNDDIPGDWASITTIWTDSPAPLNSIVDQAKQAKADGNGAMAAWTIIVLIPRGILHLASWILEHPIRCLPAGTLILIFLATL